MTETRIRVKTTLGVTDHNLLDNRFEDNQHTINAISGLEEALESKQNILTAGENIEISEEGVISAVDTTYTAGENIEISEEGVISAVDTTYTAGTNISIDNDVISAIDTTYTAGRGIDITNGVISNTQTSAEWGDIGGNLNSQTDLKNALDAKANSVDLATVATSGSYVDLSDKPAIANGILTIQKNGTTVDTFTANSSDNKTVNLVIPTTAADVNAMSNSVKYGASITMAIDSSNYQVTITLKDQDGNLLGSAQVIDLPLESVVVSGSYDSTNKNVVLTLQNGNTITFSVADLVSGLQSEITNQNKLDADLVSDTVSTNKFVTASDKTTWNGKQDAISDLATIRAGAAAGATAIQASDLATVATSGAYTDLSGKPIIPTVDQTYDATSTNAQSGTAVAAALADKQDVIDVNNKLSTDYISGLATVARSGDYTDLTNKPTIPSAQVNSDWDAVSGVAQILNKPSLATVATSGAYADLSGTPTIPTVNNATLTITQNNASVGTFTANSSSNVTLNLTDTTYSAFTGADGSSAGSTGLVPAPTASDNTKFLKGDGTWGTPSASVDYDNSTINENASNQLQTVGIVNQNTAVGAISPLKLWNGTEAEWNTGGISQTWYNWAYYNSTWTTETSGVSVQLNSITYENNKFIVVGVNGTILSSSDGSIWTEETSGVSNTLTGITYGNNKFIIVGANGTILSSSDGSTWTTETSGVSVQLNSITYENNKFIVVGVNGTILSSSDGSIWTEETSGVSNTLTGITYGNNKFIVVGVNGTILSSSDGSIWTEETSGVSNTLNGIAYGNNKFIALSMTTSIPFQSYLLYSSNGSTWSASSSIAPVMLTGITYVNNKFIAAGASGTIISSSDGNTWTTETSGVSNALNKVAYGNKKYIITGYSGIILSSTNSECFTNTANPTTESTVYSAPNTESALTITSVDTGTITLSDTNTYSYNASGNQSVNQSVGESYPNYLCFINGVGIKIGTTSIITVDQTYNASSANAQSGVAVNSVVGAIETALQGV